MKTYIIAALVAVASASKVTTVPFNVPTVDCSYPLDITADNMDYELSLFSRNFDKKHYTAAMQIYGELKKQGKDP